MRILTIIVSYNFMPWIDRCLGSLRRSETPVDVMVLDNDSKDETVEVIRRDYPEVMLRENGANLGFGRANNIGMRYALEQGYDAVLLLNQDAWVDADVVGKLASASEQYPQYGILSPIHLTGGGDAVEHGFAEYSGVHYLADQPEGDVVGVKFIDAAIWYIPTSVLRRVGLFAPIFYHYGEDTDLTNRMAYHGYRTGFLPHVYGYHAREHRKLTRAAFFRSEQVWFLAEYANINHSLPMAFVWGVVAIGKNVLRSLFRLRFRDTGTYLSIAFGLVARSAEIVRARRSARRGEVPEKL